jgi:hypothetical protein
MSEQQKPAPFKTLGSHLKHLRQASSESLAEVSGAVEIEELVLQRYEDGHERPAEDILSLLISHFEMSEHEAARLWELAGYKAEAYGQKMMDDVMNGGKNVVMLLAVDMRTAYTDSLSVATTASGVTMQFNQTSGDGNPQAVARLGMSYEQAEVVIAELQRALLHHKYLKGPKGLPSPGSHSTDPMDAPTETDT